MTSLLRKIPKYGMAPLLVSAVCGACAASGDGTEGAADDGDSSGPNLIVGDGDAQNDAGDGDGDGDPLVLGPTNQGGAGGALNGADCLAFMSWGTTGSGESLVARGGQGSIVSWLNESSTATGEHLAEKPEVTIDLLDSVDVLLLGDLTGWYFSESDKSILENWLLSGGSIFALSGYDSDEGLKVTNDLLSFAGVRFLSAQEGGETSLSISECGYCLGVTDKQEGFVAGHPISMGISAVGAYRGRAIEGEGEVVAEEMGEVLALSKEKGKGRLFLFHDDWISYRDKWEMGTPAECMIGECAEVSPSATYQVPQLWYNALRWLAPQQTCFDIEDDSIVR